MADKKVILEVEVIEGNAQSKLDLLNTSLKSLDKTHKDYKPTLALIAKAERDLAKAQQNRILVEKGLVSSSVKVDKSTKRTAKEMKQLSSDTGASTSATLELGRVLSDAPYGIRGMANNIQQLASNLFFMSKKTDAASGKTIGFKGAIGSLLGNLLGPAGLLVIFQGVVALFDWYSTRAKKVTESTKAMSEGFIGLEKDLSALYLTQEKTNKKIEDYIALSKIKSDLDAKKIENEERLKDIAKELNDLDKKREPAERLKIRNQKSYNDASDKQSVRAKGYLKGFLKQSETLIEIESSQNKLRKEEMDIIGGSLKELEAYRKNKEALTAAEKDSLKGLEKLKSEQIAIQKTLSKTSEDYIKYGKDIKETQKKIDEITGKVRKKTLVDPKEFEGDIFEVEKMLRQFRYKEVEESAKTATQKAAAKSLIELDSYKNEYKEFKDSENKKYELYLEVLNKQLSKGKITKDSYDKALAASTEEKRVKDLDAYENYLKGMKGISDRYRTDIIGEDEQLEEGEQAKRKRRQKSADTYMTQKLEKYKAYLDEASKQLGGITDFIEGEFDRELLIQQNQTNALNNELNQRLLNENLSKEERKKIQNEIALNDEKLRVKQEAIERKKFKAQKAANIAKALIDTASAAAGVMADAKGGFFARLSHAIPTIAFGLAQVATIARTKFQSSTGATPPIGGRGGSGGGDGMGDRSFDFNLVGNTLGNQITDAIQGQFNQPLKAYVVSRDITQQQAQDENIRNSASF